MNEANKPTGISFSEVFHCDNSTPVTPANCCDAQLPDEHLMTESPADNVQSVGWSAYSSCVEAAQNGVASASPPEVASLITLIQEIRCSNTNLLERVIQLEQALAQSQSDVQSYKQRSRAAQTMLDEQSQSLADAQEQAQSFSEELDAACKTIKRQQILIDNFTNQLSNSQERIAQMERECSLTQANYNDKFQQLMQTENNCRELRTRLIRQQRYTMQLKFALEKCLDSPTPSYQYQPVGQAIYSQPGEPLFPKAQPITPWSSQACFSDDLEPSWTGSYTSSQWSNEELTTNCDSQHLNSSCCAASFGLENNPTTAEQSFCFSQGMSADEDSNWQDLFNVFEAELEKETAHTDLLVDTFASSSDIKDLTKNERLQAIAVNNESYSGAETQAEKNNQFQPLETPQPKIASTVNPNWPAPLVNPLHPPKGRKSLSAIELPSFVKEK